VSESENERETATFGSLSSIFSNQFIQHCTVELLSSNLNSHIERYSKHENICLILVLDYLQYNYTIKQEKYTENKIVRDKQALRIRKNILYVFLILHRA